MSPVTRAGLVAMALTGACGTDPEPFVPAPGIEDLQVVIGPLRTCDDPDARAEQGLFVNQVVRTDPTDEPYYWGGGVAVLDLDGDGDLDVVTAGNQGPRAYRLVLGRLEAMAPPWPDTLTLDRTAGVVPVDLDGDSHLDLVLLRERKPLVFLLSDGEGGFTPAPEGYGTAGHKACSATHATLADIDHDDDLDLFVSCYGLLDISGTPIPQFQPGDANLLFEQVDGRFVDRGSLLKDQASWGYSFTGSFVDLWGDGRWSLYVGNDFGTAWGPNVLLDAEDWAMTPRPATGLELATHTMGVSFVDVTHDGILDLLVSAFGRLHMMTSGGGLWFDGTRAWGLADLAEGPREIAWGNVLADLDNDGREDAAIAFGYLESEDRWPTPRPQTDVTLWQDPDARFLDLAPTLGTDSARSSRGILAADLDRDGWLDLVTHSLDGELVVSHARCGERAWLELEARQPGTNPFAVGARVEITVGDTTWLRTIDAGGSSLGSGGPPEVHVGLDDAEQAAVRITWPDGRVDDLGEVPTRQRMRVTRR